MNKTLLLILVDFLLLTILSLTNWEDPLEQSAADKSANETTSLASAALMEQDLLDTLKESLEEESRMQLSLASELEKRKADLDVIEQELGDRDKAIESLELDVEKSREKEAELEASRRRLEKAYGSIQIEKSKLETQYGDLALKAKQTEAQSRALQAELKKKIDEVSRKEKALVEKEKAVQESKKQIQELSVQVRVSEEEKKYLLKNVDTLKQEVVLERQENVQLREQAGRLAEGVTQLAATSEDLREEFRSSVPINANQLFNDFNSNQVSTRFVAERLNRGKVLEFEEKAKTIVVSDGKNRYALTHIERTPLDFEKSPASYRRVVSRLEAGGETYEPKVLSFLNLDPRLAAVAISEENAAILGVKTYYIALDPFRFSEAVLINAQGSYYGEVEFKLDANTPGYVKMQTKILSRIFGEFSPSKGDLVLSKTGELLGIMVDRNYCAIIDNLLLKESVPLDRKFENDALKTALLSLKTRYEKLPEALQ